jgi:methylamine dehydrogenase accessory protein MauD
LGGRKARKPQSQKFMEIVTLAARLLLSGVFGVAGVTKFADPAGSRQALIDFGIPRALASLLRPLLPLAELTVAVALLPVTFAWYGALSALSLLLLFIVGICINLARGRTPDCHCFGQLSSAPVGWTTVARNAFLAGIAGAVVWWDWSHTSLSAVSWFTLLTVVQRALLMAGLIGLILLALEGWVLLQMLRQQGRLLLRLEALESRLTVAGLVPASTDKDPDPAGLPVGTPAPTFRLNGLRGEVLTLEALLAAGKPVLLLFTNPSCGPCQALMPEISRIQREHVSILTVALISEGKLADNRDKSTEHGTTQVLLQHKREVAEAYHAYGTPAAVLIDSNGTIAGALAMGTDEIRSLLSRVFGRETPVVGAFPSAAPNGRNGGAKANAEIAPLQKGQLAPALVLRDLNGKRLSLTAFRGSETLLLFWNPACGFCQQMLDDLKQLEAKPPAGAPRLLIVSSGTPKENRAMNLRSTVVLDSNSEVGTVFNANGTPMAVLLDAQGIVASDVAAGAEAVLALAGVKPSPLSE